MAELYKFLIITCICCYLSWPCLSLGNVNSARSGTSTMNFIENNGQLFTPDGQIQHIKYYLEATGLKVYFHNHGLVFQMLKKIEPEIDRSAEDVDYPGEKRKEILSTITNPAKYRFVHFEIEFDGSNDNVELTGTNLSTTTSNYYYPHCPRGISNVKHYHKLLYRNIYPHIDMVFYLEQNGTLKYDFLVGPQGNPEDIDLNYSNHSTRITPEGSLEAMTSLGPFKEDKPVTYYLDENQRKRYIESGYRLTNHHVKFDISTYPTGRPLVIDPALTWSTSIGGSDYEDFLDVQVDSDGNIFLVGTTASTDAPVVNPGSPAFFDDSLDGNSDILIVKMSKEGVREWVTYYGGKNSLSANNGNDGATACAIDNFGNLFVTGGTGSLDFPIKDNSTYLNSTHSASITTSDNADIFFLKFTSSGQLEWATLFGGNDNELPYSMATDNGGNFYTVGYTFSDNYYTYDPMNGAHFNNTFSDHVDGFITKFDNEGDLMWSTLFGDSSDVIAIVIQDNDLYLAGGSHGGGLPLANPGNGAYYDSTYNFGGSGYWATDAFISRLDTSGELKWSTYFGGSDGTKEESGYGLAIDDEGSIYMSGYTPSTDFPVKDYGQGGHFQTTVNTNPKDYAFLAKFDSLGKLEYSSLFADSTGAVVSIFMDIEVDCNHNLFFGGFAGNGNLPLTGSGADFQQSTFGGGNGDAIVGSFDADFNLTWSSYIGGSGSDWLWKTALDNNGKFYISGFVDDVFPIIKTDSSSYTQPYGGSGDGIFAKFSAINYSIQASGDNACVGDTISFETSAGVSALWNFDDPASGGQNTYIGDSTIHVFDNTGTYDVSIIVSSGCSQDTAISSITIETIPDVQVSQDSTICAGDAILLMASGGSAYSWTPSVGLNNDSIATPVASPDSTTTYTVTSINACGSTDDSITIYVVDLNPTLSANSAICFGDSIQLIATGANTYSWNGSNLTCSNCPNPTVNPSASSLYVVTISDSASGCLIQDSVFITVDPLTNPSITGITESCRDEEINLTASGGMTYLWDNSQSSISLSIYPQTDTIVTLIAMNNCDTTSSQVSITVNLPPVSDAGVDTSVVAGNTIILNGSGGINCSWSPSVGLDDPDDCSPEASPQVTTTYILTVTDANNCSATDTVLVRVLEQLYKIFVPNIFSPNNDGMNDKFQVHGEGIKEFLIVLYNRWGEKVFETTDLEIGWNGSIEEFESNLGVYTYSLNVTFLNEDQISQHGNVTLIR